jgi:hypothetical protein
MEKEERGGYYVGSLAEGEGKRGGRVYVSV